MKLELCPTEHSRRQASSRRTASWPRVFAQRVDSPEVWELHRGAIGHRDSFASAHGEFGPKWVIWREVRAVSIGARQLFHAPRGRPSS